MFKLSENFNHFSGAQSNLNCTGAKFRKILKKKYCCRWSVVGGMLYVDRVVVRLQPSLHCNLLSQRIKRISANGQVDLHGNRIVGDSTQYATLEISPRAMIHTQSISAKRLHIFAFALSIGQHTVTHLRCVCELDAAYRCDAVSLIVLIVIDSPRFISIYQFK